MRRPAFARGVPRMDELVSSVRGIQRHVSELIVEARRSPMSVQQHSETNLRPGTVPVMLPVNGVPP
jgi:hypothetical protein